MLVGVSAQANWCARCDHDTFLVEHWERLRAGGGTSRGVLVCQRCDDEWWEQRRALDYYGHERAEVSALVL
jgi:ribosomal protein S27AE